MPPYPYVEFILSVGTWEYAGEAVPDTGSEVGISIPRYLRSEILADADEGVVRTADGRLQRVNQWPGTVELEGHRFNVDVVALGNSFLIGRAVLDQLEICFEYGRRVRLTFGEG